MSKNNFTKSDSLNLIDFAQKYSFQNIDSIQIGIDYYAGDFEPNEIIVYESPIINGVSKTSRYLHAYSNYWNSSDSNQTEYKTQYLLTSLDTSNTWIVNSSKGKLDILQDRSIKIDEVNRIIDLIDNQNIKYSLDSTISINFSEPKSLKNNLRNLFRIKKNNERYFLDYGFDGNGEEIECILKKNNLIVKEFMYWIN
ncbi:MAG: hypothetical protein IPH62_19245 [Ignavibacteriae bacterium]|nr:hypothetical protein [Ignavibacteriota bacterium]